MISGINDKKCHFKSICTLQENNNRQCMKSIESNRRLWSKSLNTCNDLKAYGITESGKYFLSSPEDEDKKEPFEVECQFLSDGTVETVVKNTNNNFHDFTPCPDTGCSTMMPNYGAKNTQLSYLKKISQNCQQSIDIKCIKSPLKLLTGEKVAWWKDFMGN